tara:strand:+ start:3367 stop:3954 length:588 start_codon:yes stop_codon:yes gene_type:complete
MNIAFFDFDGTITSKDTFMLFTLHMCGSMKFVFGMILLSPILLMYKCRLISNQYMKSSVIKFYYRGVEINKLKKLSKEFNLKVIKNIIRKKAADRITWHKENNDKVVVVSASSSIWLEEWCIENNVDLIATKLETMDGKLTGNLIGMNCFGSEKVRRIKEKYELKNYAKVYAYGDSRGDKELLEFADYSDFKPFT